MTRFTMAALIVSVGLCGCVSIATHEQQMRQCEKVALEAKGLQQQVETLSSEKSKLEEALEQKNESLTDVRSTYDELIQQLKDDISKGEVGVQETEEGLMITMGNTVLFRSGQAALAPKGQKILLSVSKILKKVDDRLIQVSGHTDNVRIAGALKSQFQSNWDLSASRSASVVRFLQEKGGIDPHNLVLTAFSEYRPREDNASVAGRQQNRRVEIALIPKDK